MQITGASSGLWGPDTRGRSALARWAWVPIPLVVVLMLVLWHADLRETFVAPGLTLLLQLVFITLASGVIAYLVSRSFLASGSWGSLLLVCGIVLWGLAGVMARLAGGGNFNGSVTIHNLSVAAAAFCHLMGALAGGWNAIRRHQRHWWLLGAYALTATALLLVVRAALEGWTPRFFVQGEGGTLVRQFVLGCAIAMFASSALLLWTRSRRAASPFAYWYALGLGLYASGLFGVLISTVHSGALNWAGVLTQCLSGVYLVAAAHVAAVESEVSTLSFAEAPREASFRYGLAFMFVAAALAVRLLLHDSVSDRAVSITFFPAVILATLFGGRGPGLFATVLSVVAIDFFFVEPGGSFSTGTAGDRIVLALFIASCLLVVWIIGLMQQSQARASAAEERRRALQDADRAKDEFLAMLSHELRNPLAALTSASHVLRMGEPGSAPSVQARGIIERQTEHMSRLIDDLLDVSRVRLGKLGLERQVFDLAEMTAATVEAWRASGRLARRAAVNVRASEVWVEGDRVRIEQVLANLLDNALKFTPADGAIAVSAVREGEQAVLTVADTGRGVARDMLERIFEPFVQAEHAPARSTGGLGVGLALAKRLTELHGGSIAASSGGTGKGATFTVRLPAAAAPQMRQAKLAERKPGPRRVLVIEDNEDARRMLGEALALSGHEVREAASGAAGIEAAADAWPEVALVDIGLPDMEGYEVARRLRGKLRLIAVTGYGQPQDLARSREAGFDAHLVKPVSPERLNDVMARLA